MPLLEGPEQELSDEEALAFLQNPEPAAGGEPELSDDEALAFLQTAPPKPSAFGAFAGPFLERTGNIAEAFRQVGEATRLPEIGGVPIPEMEPIVTQEKLRGLAQQVYPQEVRGQGGMTETALNTLGAFAPSAIAGLMGGPQAMMGASAADRYVSTSQAVQGATGDAGRAKLAGGLSATLAIPEALLGAGGSALRLFERLSANGIPTILKAIGEEVPQEMFDQAATAALEEHFTGKDRQIWEEVKQTIGPSAFLAALVGGAEAVVGRPHAATQETSAVPPATQGSTPNLEQEAPAGPTPEEVDWAKKWLGRTQGRPLPQSEDQGSIAEALRLASEAEQAGGKAPVPGPDQQRPTRKRWPMNAKPSLTEEVAVPKTEDEAKGLVDRLWQIGRDHNVPQKDRMRGMQKITEAPDEQGVFDTFNQTIDQWEKDKLIPQRVEEEIPETPAPASSEREGYIRSLDAIGKAVGASDQDMASAERAMRAVPEALGLDDEYTRIANDLRRRAQRKHTIGAEANVRAAFPLPDEPTPPDTRATKTVLGPGLAIGQAARAQRQQAGGQQVPVASPGSESGGPLPGEGRQPASSGVTQLFSFPGPSPFGKSPNITTGKVKRFVREFFTSAGDTPVEARRETEIIKGSVNAEIEDVARNSKALDSAMRSALGRNWQETHGAQVDAAFEGDTKALADMPVEAGKALVAMRAHLDRLIRSQVKEGGVIDPKRNPEFAAKILGSEGRYANRSYRAFIDPEWADKVPPEVRQRLFTLWQSWAQPLGEGEIKALRKKSMERPQEAVDALKRRREINKMIDALPKGDPRIKALRDERRRLRQTVKLRTEAGRAARTELQGRKRLEGKADAEIQSDIDALLQEAKETADNPWASLAAGKLGRKDLSIFKRRKDVPKELRELLGEIESPLANYANSVVKIASVVAKHEGYTKIREHGLGTWLHEQPTGKHTARLSAEGTPGLRPLDGLYTTPEIKKALTEVTPQDVNVLVKGALHANNFIKWGKVLGQPWAFTRNLLGNVTQTVANGHLPTFFRGKEWAQAFGKGGLDEQKRLIRLGVVGEGISTYEWQDLRSNLKKTLSETGEVDHNVARQAKRGVERLFEAGDNLPKIRFFYAEEAALKDAGYSAKEAESLASDRVRDLFPTTARAPKALKKFRGQPILGSYFAFKAEIIRTMGNRLRLISEELKSENPKVRMMGARRAAGTLVATTITPAVAYAVNMMNGVDADEDEDRREFLPPWDKNSRIVWFGGENKGRYMDLSDVDPFTMFTDPLARVMAGADAGEAMENWAKEEGDAFFGWSPGAQIAVDLARGETESGAPIDNRAEYIRKAVQPGVVSSYERGKEKGFGPEVGAAVSGFRRYDFDVEKSFGYDVSRFSWQIRDATSAMKRQSKKSPKEAEEFRSMAERERQDLFRELSNKAKAAIRLGVPYSKVRAMLDESLSREVTNAILMERYVAYKERK